MFERITEKASLSENTARLYMSHILSALSYSHSNGFTHNNLRPTNIIFDSKSDDSSLKLIGFSGDWKLEKENSKLYYMAPEMIKNPCEDPKCDVWSAGVILFIMIMGRPPFTGKKPKEIYDKIQ